MPEAPKLQFSLAIIHALHSLYIDCNFPKWMHYTLIGYAISFIILFTNFYIQTYIKRGQRKASSGRQQDGITPIANGIASRGAEKKEN